jgi:hypothetical protein
MSSSDFDRKRSHGSSTAEPHFERDTLLDDLAAAEAALRRDPPQRFLAVRQTTWSNEASGNGICATSPFRKSISTPARAAFSLAIRTNERLMSNPVT